MASIRQKKAQKKNLQAIIIILFVIASLVTFILVKHKIESERVEINNINLCPLSVPYDWNLVLVDKTDNINRIQALAFERKLDRIIDDLKLGDRLTIYVIDKESRKSMKPIFDACNPGSSSDANPLYENPAFYKKRWDDMFSQPLQIIRLHLSDDNTEDRSPIFEMIQALSLTSLQESLTNRKKIRLHIFSDMLHHTKGYSLYRKDALDFNNLINTSYFRGVKTNLYDADIFLYYIRRQEQENLQTNRNVLFWEKYFNAINSRVVNVEKLEG